MTELSTEERNALPSSAFVFPKSRRYPIHDINHARNALARVSAEGSDYEKEQVKKKVYRKFPSLNPNPKRGFFGRLSARSKVERM